MRGSDNGGATPDTCVHLPCMLQRVCASVLQFSSLLHRNPAWIPSLNRPHPHRLEIHRHHETQKGNIAAKKKKHLKNPPPHTKHKGETLRPRRKNTKRIHRRTQNTKGKHCGPKEITPEEGLNGLPSPLLLGLLSPPACSPFAAMRKH